VALNNYKEYIASTLAYGLAALIAILLGAVFIFQEKWLPFIISLLILYVSLDNFFCSSRAKACGIKAKGHYTIPKFLKKK